VRRTLDPDDPYADFVPHPRYGRRPRITGLDPKPDDLGRVFLHWHSPAESRIPNTAIAADLSRQPRATVAVTHYFDAKRRCRDCRRPFLFFAEEQKYWYEELGFALESDCVRCIDCRRRQRGLEQKRERYAELLHVPDRTTEQNLEWADCCLTLVEADVFPVRPLERVQSVLKRISAELDRDTRDRLEELRARVAMLERR
jgi:putative zinc ribbon protein